MSRDTRYRGMEIALEVRKVRKMFAAEKRDGWWR